MSARSGSEPSAARDRAVRPPSGAHVTAVLDDVAAVGPFFELPVLAGQDTTPFSRLHTDPGPLADRITRVRASLGSDERVAASIAFQGLVARLVSAPLAAVVLHGMLPDLTGLCRRPDSDDPWAPGLSGSAGTGTPDPIEDPAGAAGRLAEDLVDSQLAPLVEAVRGLVPVSGHVLRGNITSALAGSARVLDSARPASRPAVLGVLGALLAHPSLRGTGRLLLLEPDVPDTEWGFRRHSCCLYYRIPDGGRQPAEPAGRGQYSGKCGDCVLSG